MDENNIFQEPAMPDGKKPLDVTSLVLGIVAILAAAFVPLVSYICGGAGLGLATKHSEEKRTTAGRVVCIIGLVLGVVSHVIGAFFLTKAMFQ